MPVESLPIVQPLTTSQLDPSSVPAPTPGTAATGAADADGFTGATAGGDPATSAMSLANGAFHSLGRLEGVATVLEIMGVYDGQSMADLVSGLMPADIQGTGLVPADILAFDRPAKIAELAQAIEGIPAKDRATLVKNLGLLIGGAAGNALANDAVATALAQTDRLPELLAALAAHDLADAVTILASEPAVIAAGTDLIVEVAAAAASLLPANDSATPAVRTILSNRGLIRGLIADTLGGAHVAQAITHALRGDAAGALGTLATSNEGLQALFSVRTLLEKAIIGAAGKLDPAGPMAAPRALLTYRPLLSHLLSDSKLHLVFAELLASLANGGDISVPLLELAGDSKLRKLMVKAFIDQPHALEASAGALLDALMANPNVALGLNRLGLKRADLEGALPAVPYLILAAERAAANDYPTAIDHLYEAHTAAPELARKAAAGIAQQFPMDGPLSVARTLLSDSHVVNDFLMRSSARQLFRSLVSSDPGGIMAAIGMAVGDKMLRDHLIDALAHNAWAMDQLRPLGIYTAEQMKDWGDNIGHILGLQVELEKTAAQAGNLFGDIQKRLGEIVSIFG
jgi:hypothetical protein